jgi:hypothetical protein
MCATLNLGSWNDVIRNFSETTLPFSQNKNTIAAIGRLSLGLKATANEVLETAPEIQYGDRP